MDDQTLAPFIKLIKEHCSEFLELSFNEPVMKTLPAHYTVFDKVKVRHKAINDDNHFGKAFNAAFGEFSDNLYGTSVSVIGESVYIPTQDSNQSDYYVFPLNGFKFIYNENIGQLLVDGEQVAKTLRELMPDDEHKAHIMLAKSLRLAYSTDSLYSAIISGSEILFYNIPQFYVLKRKFVTDYDELFA